ncbi:hypothetical protein NL676_036326 [Syzygium grande]|nr:hypothetical protein NL676_036326 [Syzygium grande]
MQPPPSSREIQGGLSSLLGLHAAAAAGDDFFDQVMLSSVLAPAWPDLAPANAGGPIELPDEAAAARLHQIGNGGSKAAMMMQQQHQHQHQMLLMPHDVADGSGQGGGRGGGGHGGGAAVQSLYDGFAGSLHASGQAPNPTQLFRPPQQGGGAIQAAPNFAAQAAASASAGGGGGGGGGGGAPAAQPKQQRVRARRGQATDPHSIAERLRRERIAERMKALQELVPNANKTDKASMLDEIIDYVKFLQLQVKVLSVSRLGGAAGGVAPLVAAMSFEGGGGDCIQAGQNGSNGGHQAAASSSAGDGLMVAENQVAKLMDEDMGSAMQYLQGKGLCLMPISLATTISSATSHRLRSAPARPGNLAALGPGGEGPPASPSVSVLTVQSAALGNGLDGRSGKDAASVSKP